ncbi:MAG: inner membrane-spanning protein YciB [Alphaproteobacteria bacterium]
MKKLSQTLLAVSLDFLPLVLFFLTNKFFGIITGTLVYLISTCLATIISLMTQKRLPLFALVAGSMVVGLGLLTVFLNNPLFIKIQPTITNLIFGAGLLFSAWKNLQIMKKFFSHMFVLTRDVWRNLEWRWGIFFIFLALINEVARIQLDNDGWLAVKLFVVAPATCIFAFINLSYIRKSSNQ